MNRRMFAGMASALMGVGIASTNEAAVFQKATNPLGTVAAPVMNVGLLTGWVMAGVDGEHERPPYFAGGRLIA